MNTSYEALDFTKLKPCNYNRKSSEGEDKQMLSVSSQIDEANRISEYYKLPSFVEVFQESKSAKKEFLRPEFMKMIEMIKSGKIDSIVCWKLDRLARNMTEGGMLIDLLSSAVHLKAIITHDKVYYPSDNVLLMSVEFGQGKQFVKDLSTNVKRGQTKKASMGIPHGVATLGFLNDRREEKGNRTWYVDEERFWKVEKLLRMFLTGTWSAGKLHKYAVDELKLTTPKHKRCGGMPIVLSRIYTILKDPIYAGFFFYQGQRYQLDKSFPYLLTEAEHLKIKQLLSKKHIPKVQHHQAVYSGFINSTEGDFMGQDIKFQVICDCKHKFAYRSKTNCPKCDIQIDIMNNPKYLIHSYYYNIRKKKAGEEYKSISELAITNKLVDFADKNLNFSNDLLEWSKKYIHELKDQEVSENILISKNREVRKDEYELKKSKLRGMLRDEKITDEEYKTDLSILNKEYADTSSEVQTVDWYKEMIEITNILEVVIDTLKNGTFESKRSILSRLGSNLTWNDEILNISNSKSIDTLIKGVNLIKSEYPKFEPKLSFSEQGLNEKTDPLQPVFSKMLLR